MTQWIVTSCVLILAVLGLRFILKGRVSLRLQYALWLLVAVRLLVPLTFGESNISAANLSLSAQPMVQQMESVEIPVQSFDSAYEEVVREHIDQGQDISGFENTEELEYEAYERMEKISLSQLLAAVWTAGMALSFAVLLFSNLHFAAKLRRTRRPIVLPNATLPVYCAPQIVTPCLFGLFRPAIYLTEDVLADPQALNHVLAHEHTHHRHGDHLWAVLRGICLCIHWYNPLVWIAAIVSRSDGELACDEAAIASLGEENRLDYGRTLIGLTCAKGASPLLTATTMTGSKHSIKERITLIAKKPEFSLIALIALILAVTVAAGCSFTGPAAQNRDPNKPMERDPRYEVLAYPGTEWGMNPNEVMKALKLKDEDVTITAVSEHCVSTETEVSNIFGSPAKVTFFFYGFSYPDPTSALNCYFLTATQVIYPDDTDMNKVRTEVSRIYGEPTLPDAPPHLNLVRPRLESTKGHVSRWDSEPLIGDLISEEYAEYKTYTSSHFGPAPEEVEKLKQEPAAQLWWTDDARWLTVGTAGVDETASPGIKGLLFSAETIAYDRGYTHTGFLRPIEIDECKLSYSTEFGIRLPVITSMITQEQVAGIAIDDAKINVKEISHNVQARAEDTLILLYEVTWQVKPETTEGVILQEGQVLKDGWIVPEEARYILQRYEYNQNGSYGNGIPITETLAVLDTHYQSELEATYGTPEMLEQYGDMYTAYIMTVCPRTTRVELIPQE